MGKVDFKKLIIAAVAGTAAMTAFMFMAPMMGMPEMNIGKMLSMQMGMPEMAGWIMHFVNGIILTWIYAAFLIDRLPTDGWKRGMIYSLIPWAVMNFMAMPMMGMGIFSGGMMVIVGTVVAHFAYGGVMGAIYTGEASTDAATDDGSAAEPVASAAAAPVSEPEPTPEPEPAPEPEPEAPAEDASSPEPEPASEPEAPAEEESNPDPSPEAESDSEEEEESEEGGADD